MLQAIYKRGYLTKCFHGGVTLLLFVLLAFGTSFAQSPKKAILGGAEWAEYVSDTCYVGPDMFGMFIKNTRHTEFWDAVRANGGKMTLAQQQEFEQISTSEIVIDFGPGFALLGDDEQAARDAFRFAADIWETEVVSNVPILIAADFANLGGGVLGQNGSPRVTNVPNGVPEWSYTLALGNAIAGFDLAPGTPNGNQTYNTEFNWYFPTDGNTPPGIIDFTTVVLHEIGHSMGIAGLSNGGGGVGGNGGNNPAPWDVFVELGDGTPILDLGFGSPEQVAALVSGDLFMNSPLAFAALGGQRAAVFAPNPFQGGSSYSHWDEATFPPGSGNSLMTPFAEAGFANFDIGDLNRGHLADQGWVLSSNLESQDVGVFAVSSPVSDPDLGTESITVTLRNFGIDTNSTSFDVSYFVDGGAVVTETFTGEIPPVSSVDFTFATPFDFGADGTSFSLTAFTSFIGDEDSSNDSITVSIINQVPEIDVPVTSLTYGAFGIGDQSTQDLQIDNPAAGDLAGNLQITDLQFSNPDFSSTATLPFTVAPGSSENLPVTFSPSALGEISGTLTLVNNAGEGILISLSGSGANPAIIAVSTDSINSVLDPGQTETQTFTVSNNGEATLVFDLSFGDAPAPSMEGVSVAAPMTSNSTMTSAHTGLLSRSPNPNVSLNSIGEDVALASVNPDDFIYRLDDGSSDNNIGAGNNIDLLILNSFQTVSGAQVISSIAAAASDGPPGLTGRFILFEDPTDDGDPSDAVLLTEATGVFDSPGTDNFVSVNIEPTSVSGVFFVGLLISVPEGPDLFPLALDGTASQQSSWVVGNEPAGNFNFDDLTANSLALGLIDGFNFPGNWLLRANGTFFSAAPLSGSLAQGESVEVSVDLFAGAPGDYSSNIIIDNNDPSNNQVVVPVNLLVNGLPITVEPTTLTSSLPQGQTETQTFTMTNTSSSDVPYVITPVEGGEVQSVRVSPVNNQVAAPSDPRTEFVATSLDLTSSAAILAPQPFEANTVQLETGFEDFSLGDIDGQQGWAGQFANWQVETSNPATGAQQVRSLADGLGQTLAFSPDVGIGSEEFSSLSMDLNIQGSDVTWQVIPQSPTAGSVITRFQYGTDGSLSALVDDGNGNAIFVPINAPSPTGYFNLIIEVERATSLFSILIDGENVFTGQGFAGDIEQLVMLSLMEVAGPTLDFDNVQIIDGTAGEFVSPITATPGSGVIPANGTVEVEVLFDANQPFGTYNTDLVIGFGENQNFGTVTVNTTLDVTGPSFLVVDPTVIQEEVDFGQVNTRTLSLSNQGGEPIEFTLDVIGAEVNAVTEGLDLSGQETLGFVPATDPVKLAADVRRDVDVMPGTTPVFMVSGEVILEEDFNNGFPETWSVVNAIDNSVSWGLSEYASEGIYTGTTGDAATASSDQFGPAAYDTELRTPVINIAGKSSLMLQYTANYQNVIGNDDLDVDISTDGGSTWTTMLNWSEDHGGFRATPGEEVLIDVSQFAGSAEEVIIRWRYYNLADGAFDWYAQIDDVTLFEGAAVWLTVGQAAGTVGVGETLEIPVSFDGTVVDPGFYVAGIIVNSDAANLSQVGVVASMDLNEPAVITVEPTSLSDTLTVNLSSTQTVTITNSGESALNFNIARQFTVVEPVTDANAPVLVSKVKQANPTVSEDFMTTSSLFRVGGMPEYLGIPGYATDLESFNLGDINGQGSWFAQFGNYQISDANPSGGAQHLQVISDGLGNTLAFSPEVGIGSQAVSALSMDVSIQGLGATWDIIPQSPTAELVNTRLRYNVDGTWTVLARDTSGTSVFFPIDTETPAGYFNIRIEIERATSAMEIYFDNTLVFSGEAVTGNIEQLVFLSFMEVAGPSLEVDNIQILDGVPFFSTSPTSGSVAGGSSVDIDVTFDATGLTSGVYTDAFIVSSNDLTQPEVQVDLELTVEDPPLISVDPDTINEILPQGATSTRTLSISNSGEADLEFTIDVVAQETGTTQMVREFAPNMDALNDPRIQAKLAKDGPIQMVTQELEIQSNPLLGFLTEDFEGGVFPPAGWTTIDNIGNGLVFDFAASFGEGNYTSTGEAATSSSDAFGSAAYDTELRTPVIDVTGKKGVILQYSANYQNFAQLDTLDTDISTDGGATWTNILRWNEDHGGFRSEPGELVTIPLDGFIGEASTIMIRWRYYDTATGAFNWYAQIDDVVIGTEVISASPLSGTVPSGQTLEIDVNFDASGVPAGEYGADLVINSNDQMQPTLVVPANLTVTGVSGFTFVSATNDQDLFPIENGMLINLNDFPNQRFSIRANTVPADFGSVSFEVSGSQNFVRTENDTPFHLFGDSQGNVYPWSDLAPGTYTITATPYSGRNLMGEAGSPASVSFEVVDEFIPEVSLAILDTRDDSNVGNLSEGQVIDLNALGTDEITIQALGNNIGSARFITTGAEERDRLVSHLDIFTLLGNTSSGEVRAWKPTIGSYSLTVIVFEKTFERGASDTIMVNFSVENNVSLSYDLVDAATNAVLVSLTDGSVVDLDTLTAESVNIVATPSNGVGSMVLDLDGPVSSSGFDNAAPFAVFGMGGSILEAGSYTLNAKAHNRGFGSGAVLAEETISFEVSGGSEEEAGSGEDLEVTVQVYPNPSPDMVQVALGNGEGDLTITLMDAQGNVITSQSYGNSDAAELYVRGGLQGLYFLQIVKGETTTTKRVIVE